MGTDIRKSLNAILYDRVTSPFYGTLIVTWLIWNWKIWYLTIFIDKEDIKGTKIDFIVCNYAQFETLIYLPIISTIIILTIMPFISNGSYWLELKFKSWRVRQRNLIESKQTLTIEQSVRLRQEIREQEKSFEAVIQKKNDEIDLLNNQIREIENQIKREKEDEDKPLKPVLRGRGRFEDEYFDLKQKTQALNVFENVYKTVKNEKKMPSDISEDIQEYFLINNIIRVDVYKGEKYYYNTDKSEDFYRRYFNEFKVK